MTIMQHISKILAERIESYDIPEHKKTELKSRISKPHSL